jgi:hypothetical protein
MEDEFSPKKFAEFNSVDLPSCLLGKSIWGQSAQNYVSYIESLKPEVQSVGKRKTKKNAKSDEVRN